MENFYFWIISAIYNFVVYLGSFFPVAEILVHKGFGVGVFVGSGFIT